MADTSQRWEVLRRSELEMLALEMLRVAELELLWLV